LGVAQSDAENYAYCKGAHDSSPVMGVCGADFCGVPRL
jgi:hypothetical protein